jgi:hypothetical protein
VPEKHKPILISPSLILRRGLLLGFSCIPCISLNIFDDLESRFDVFMLQHCEHDIGQALLAQGAGDLQGRG